MAQSQARRVTPIIQKCLEELKSSIKAMPASEAKTRSKAALRQLEEALSGRRRPPRENVCPMGSDIKHS